MLTITVPSIDLWDEANQEFISMKEQTLRLEHSLVSLSKWESKWNKPYISKQEKTYEETIDYIKCMTLSKNVDPNVYNCLTNANLAEIREYIDAPMTATTFVEDKSFRSNNEIVTSEIIYYWMVSLNIPFECEKWHLNRLFTLIRVCNVKNQPPKKMSKREIASRNAQINAARRKKYNTKG